MCVSVEGKSGLCVCACVCVEIGLCVGGDYVVCVFSCACGEMGCVCLSQTSVLDSENSVGYFSSLIFLKFSFLKFP